MWTYRADGTSIYGLSDVEDQISEGNKGRVDLTLRSEVSQSLLEDLETKLVESGVLEAKVTGSGKSVSIYFRKGFPWLAIIVSAIVGLIVLAILIVSWKLYEDVPIEFQGPVLLIVALAGFVFLITILLLAIRRS